MQEEKTNHEEDILEKLAKILVDKYLSKQCQCIKSDHTNDVPRTRQKLLTEEETARYICMSTSFLRLARCQGQTGKRTPGPPYIKIGRAVRCSIDDLDRWLKENRIQ